MKFHNADIKNFKRLVKTETMSAQGQTNSYAVISNSDFKGKLDQLSASETTRESRNQYTATHRLFIVGVSVPLVQSGRIRETTNNIDYDIVSFEKLHNHHTEAILSEVTN